MKRFIYPRASFLLMNRNYTLSNSCLEKILEESVSEARRESEEYERVIFHAAVFAGWADIPSSLSPETKYLEYESFILGKRLATIAVNMAVARSQSNMNMASQESISVQRFDIDMLGRYVDQMFELREKLLAENPFVTIQTGIQRFDESKSTPVWKRVQLFEERNHLLNPLVCDVLRDEEASRGFGRLDEIPSQTISDIFRYFNLLNVLDTYREDSVLPTEAERVYRNTLTVFGSKNMDFPFWYAARSLTSIENRNDRYATRSEFLHKISQSGKNYMVFSFDAKGFNAKNKADMEQTLLKMKPVYDACKKGELTPPERDEQIYTLISGLLRAPDFDMKFFNDLVFDSIKHYVNYFNTLEMTQEREVIGSIGGDEVMMAVEVSDEMEGRKIASIIDETSDRMREIQFPMRGSATYYVHSPNLGSMVNMLERLDYGLKRAKFNEKHGNNHLVYIEQEYQRTNKLATLPKCTEFREQVSALNAMLDTPDVKESLAMQQVIVKDLFDTYYTNRRLLSTPEDQDDVTNLIMRINPSRPAPGYDLMNAVAKLSIAGSFQSVNTGLQDCEGFMVGRKFLNSMFGETRTDNLLARINKTIGNIFDREKIGISMKRSGEGYFPAHLKY
jgi:hypothetical protein